MTTQLSAIARDHFAALTTAAGLVDLPGRTQIELTGDDRATFLHNLCTNEIKKLTVGNGVEAMLLNAKGHVLFHGLVFHRGESLVIDSVAGVNERLAQHLDRYLIREKVTIVDRTHEWRAMLLVGPTAPTVLQACGVSTISDTLPSTSEVTIAEQSVQLRRVPFTTLPSFELVTSIDGAARVRQTLLDAGAQPCELSSLEALRIEAGWPSAEVDITDKNLPQELNRDTTAINFNKGCYIGQETVARIDALGHVNKYLGRVQFAADAVPTVGSELSSAGQSVGHVTSCVYHPGRNTHLALAYLRRGLHTPGTKLDPPLTGEVV